ncbi:MAG: hypothetical protein ACYSWU_24370 [Planctomycetota bacterium]
MLLDGVWRPGGLTFLLVLAFCGGGGCGGPGDPCSLTGQVTFNGRPLGEGDLRLDPIEETPGPGGSAKIIGGRYEIPRDAGMLAGKHRVRVTATRATGRMVENPDAFLGPVAGPAQEPEIVQYIPAKYNADSELTVTLVAGENQHDFAVEAGK